MGDDLPPSFLSTTFSLAWALLPTPKSEFQLPDAPHWHKGTSVDDFFTKRASHSHVAQVGRSFLLTSTPTTLPGIGDRAPRQQVHHGKEPPWQGLLLFSTAANFLMAQFFFGLQLHRDQPVFTHQR